MKICLLNNLYEPYQRGGAEKVVKAYIQKLQAEGHEVFLITTRARKFFKSEFKSKQNFNYRAHLKTEVLTERDQKIKIYYLNSHFSSLVKMPVFFRLCWHWANIFSFRKYFKIKRILQLEKPDLVISHNLMGLGFLSILALQKFTHQHQHYLHDIQLLHPSGLICWQKESKIDSISAKIYQAINRFYLQKTTLIISPSTWLLTEHQKRGFFTSSQTKIEPIANLSLQKVVVQINKTDSHFKTHSKKRLLFAGQLECHKGILFLVQSFLTWANHDWELIIAGSGSLEQEIKTLSQATNNIKLVGFLNNADLQQLLTQVDLLIVPSLCYENSPTIILEAQTVNLPVVAANLGGISELVKANNSLFIPGDQADLYQKINALLTSTDL